MAHPPEESPGKTSNAPRKSRGEQHHPLCSVFFLKTYAIYVYLCYVKMFKKIQILIFNSVDFYLKQICELFSVSYCWTY